MKTGKIVRRTVLFAALMILICGSAMAAGGPTNPYYYDAQPPVIETGGLTAQSGPAITINCLAGPSFTGDTTWTVDVSGAEGSVTYEFYVLDDAFNPEGANTNGYSGPQTSNTFSYRFVTPNEYVLLVLVSDDTGTYQEHEMYTLAGDGVHPTTSEKVEQLAAECIAAGCKTDLEKAIWMHDWLTMNAFYDQSLTYYSADGVLIRGTGVCDSYRKAYELLMNAVGVETVSAIGGNHAWNQVKLNGEWYNVDVTWDDPVTGEDVMVSGYEGHFYLGLPYEIMAVDHVFETNPKECTAYDQNYFLGTGMVRIWADDFKAEIAAELNGRALYFDLELPDYYALEEEGYYSYGKEYIVYPLTAYELRRSSWTVGGKPIGVDTWYEDGAAELAVETVLDEYTLELPAGLKSIGAEAFESDAGCLAVVVPEGAETIEEKAFAGCGDLWKIVLPVSISRIGEDAFADCGNAVVVCAEGSYADGYAGENGMSVIHN